MDINSNKYYDSLLFDLLSQINFSRKVRLSEEIFVILRGAIIEGTLPSGYVFPNENEMCKMLDIGRSTLREAYFSLEVLNLITRTKNGTYINSAEEIRNIRTFDVVAAKTNPMDLMEYREILETGIIYNAALNATPEDIKKLEAIIAKQEANVNDIDLITRLDYEFHAELARVSRNELLLISINAIRSCYEHFAYTVYKKTADFSFQDHYDIVDALRQNDFRLAKRAVRKHLRNIKKVALEGKDNSHI